MKTRTIVLIMLFIGTGVQAQLLKKIAKRAAKAAEETVLQKVDEKTTKKTGKAMDTIFDGKQKNKKRKRPNSPKEGNNKNAQSKAPNKPRSVQSVKDFTSGTKILYSDSFVNDAIGDFPVTWNTNASAEVVTFEGDDTRWLQLANSGNFTPDGITNIPENATLEFDLYVPDNYAWQAGGLSLYLVEATNKTKDFMSPNYLDGVSLWFHPVKYAGNGAGISKISNRIGGEKILANTKDTHHFSYQNNSVHVAIWRQKTRIRVYIDNHKIWDIPRAFGNANYNSIVLRTWKSKEDAHFYVTNFKLAVAGEDKRHALLETGHFETNEILFDTGKSTIQTGSTSILDELGQLLEKNTEFNISIIGHTDADGAVATNQKLSEDRARSVKEYLTDNFAIKGNRLAYKGMGASQPIAPNDTAAGKRKNRRVEFIKM